MNKKEMNNKGFSLVELIIVIAIMAILVGVLAPQFIKYVESSRQSTDIQNASEIRAAVEAFVAENAPTTDIVVACTASTMTVTGGSYTDSAGNAQTVTKALSEVGLSDSITTKSSSWTANTALATYSVTDYKWTVTSSVNTKEPKKDLGSAFK